MAGDLPASLTTMLASSFDFRGLVKVSMACIFPMMEGKSFDENEKSSSHQMGTRRQDGFTW